MANTIDVEILKLKDPLGRQGCLRLGFDQDGNPWLVLDGPRGWLRLGFGLDALPVLALGSDAGPDVTLDLDALRRLAGTED